MSTTVYSGAFSTRPAASTLYDLFLPTDGIHFYWDDGSNWQAWGPFYSMTQPPITGWSWVNQGSATVQENSAIQLYTPSEATVNFRCRVRSMPTPPWNLTCAMVGTIMDGVNNRGMGVLCRDSATNRLLTFNRLEGYGNISVLQCTSPTSINSSVALTTIYVSQLNWFKIVDDNINFTFYYSQDGQNWIQIYQSSRTTWLANPDQIGIFLASANPGYGHQATILHWLES